MNIVITTPLFPTAPSPFPGIFIAEQAAALCRDGHRVVIVCARQQLEIKRWPVMHQTHYDWFGLPVVQIDYPIVRKAGYLPCLLGVMLAFRQVFRYFKPALIHAHYTLPVGLAALFTGRLLRLPVLITEHFGPIRELRRRWLNAWGLRFALHHADVVITVSEHLERELISEVGLTRRMHVIPNLFDPRKFYPALQSHTPACPLDVMFVGRGGDAGKGNDVMLKAFAQAAPQSERPLRLVLVGRGLSEELQPLARDLGIVAHCLFTGELHISHLATLMRQGGFLVVASRYETFSLVVVEAMACGKPVIATQCGGPEELVTPRTGVLVPPDDVQALAQAIVEMSKNLHHYEAQSISRYAYERYSDVVVGRQLRLLYEGLLAQSHSCQETITTSPL